MKKINIVVPPIRKQKKYVASKKKQIRSSYELSYQLLDKLDELSDNLEKSPSILVQEIIENTHLDPSKFKKRAKSLTLKQMHIDKVSKLGEKLLLNNKRKVNRNAVLELT